MCCGDPHIRVQDQILFCIWLVSEFVSNDSHDQELDGENGPITSAHTVMFTSELDMY